MTAAEWRAVGTGCRGREGKSPATPPRCSRRARRGPCGRAPSRTTEDISSATSRTQDRQCWSRAALSDDDLECPSKWRPALGWPKFSPYAAFRSTFLELFADSADYIRASGLSSVGRAERWRRLPGRSVERSELPLPREREETVRSLEWVRSCPFGLDASTAAPRPAHSPHFCSRICHGYCGPRARPPHPAGPAGTRLRHQEARGRGQNAAPPTLMCRPPSRAPPPSPAPRPSPTAR